MQIEVGCEAARGTEKPEKLGFVIGFLLGQEAIWLSESLRILREEAPDVEITLMTKSSHCSNFKSCLKRHFLPVMALCDYAPQKFLMSVSPIS